MTVTRELIREKYKLDGIFCTSCLSDIEDEIAKLPQVAEVSVNNINGSIIISGVQSELDNIEPDIENIVGRIEPGVELKRADEDQNISYESSKENVESNIERDIGGGIDWLFASGSIIFIFTVIILETSLFSFDIPRLKIFLYLTAYLLSGRKVIISAVDNIRNGRFFSEYFLMTAATIGAFIIGEYTEAVAVMLFYMTGELFQQRAVDNSRRSIKDLMAINPEYAHLKTGHELKKVVPSRINIGEEIVVKPGERIPLDGVIIEGNSYLDTSALTGESVPRRVEEGDQVLSGVINREGLLTIRVTKEYADSTVKKILDLVENAAHRKAPIEKFITRFSRYYTPAVVYTALGIAVLPSLLIPGAVFSNWFYRALIFLVISCPCALVISVPLGIFAGIGKASRQGILVKGGNYLEALNDVNTIVFDKTGTLTHGIFRVEKVKPEADFNEKEVLGAAARAESHSTHPIAISIQEAYGKNVKNEVIDSYRELPGRGIKARIDGQEILVGNSELLLEEGIKLAVPAGTESGIKVAIDGVYAGEIVIRDQIKTDAKEAIAALREQGVEKLIMLTGDEAAVAEEVASALELDGYYAGLLPDDKVERVEELLSKLKSGAKLAFVGDGINDAPVLARSDIGIAMGGLGSDAAIEAADIVLTDDQPRKLAVAIKVAARTRRIVRQNILLALGVKGAVLILGIWGMASMWGAVFADVGVALLAVINSLRILR